MDRIPIPTCSSRLPQGTPASILRYSALKHARGGIDMTGFVSQLSTVVAYAAMAFVGAIVLGVL